jgi:hypothetical protein
VLPNVVVLGVSWHAIGTKTPLADRHSRLQSQETKHLISLHKLYLVGACLCRPCPIREERDRGRSNRSPTRRNSDFKDLNCPLAERIRAVYNPKGLQITVLAIRNLMAKRALQIILGIGFVVFFGWRWQADTRQEIIDDYMNHARQYGPTASPEAIRRVTIPYASQLHTLRTNKDFRRCVNYIRGVGGYSKPVDTRANEDFRLALLALSRPENQQAGAKLDKEKAREIRTEIWRLVMNRNQLPDDLSLLGEISRASTPENERLLCLLGDDVFQYLLALGNSPEATAVGRLWLSSLGR